MQERVQKCNSLGFSPLSQLLWGWSSRECSLSIPGPARHTIGTRPVREEGRRLRQWAWKVWLSGKPHTSPTHKKSFWQLLTTYMSSMDLLAPGTHHCCYSAYFSPSRASDPTCREELPPPPAWEVTAQAQGTCQCQLWKQHNRKRDVKGEGIQAGRSWVPQDWAIALCPYSHKGSCSCNYNCYEGHMCEQQLEEEDSMP